MHKRVSICSLLYLSGVPMAVTGIMTTDRAVNELARLRETSSFLPATGPEGTLARLGRMP